MRKKIRLLLIVLTGLSLTACKNSTKEEKKATIGVYFFDGWGGRHQYADDPNEPWAKNAPLGLSKSLLYEFSGREPLWGWRGDTQEIMERQIDLAADHGIDFFVFCWYWRDSKRAINPEAIEAASQHKSMQFYLTAKNKNRLKYSLLVANHGGSEIEGVENWKAAVRYWTKYFKDPQFATVDGKPLVVIFNPGGITNEDMAAMQEEAKKEGFKNGLAIAGCRPSAKQKSGFTHSTNYAVAPNGYTGITEEHKYAEIVKESKQEWTGTEQQPYIPLLTSGWDKRPWDPPFPDGHGHKAGAYFPDSTPENFKNFLLDAIQWMNEHPKETTKEKVVLIYAWNEFGEGGYLAPTKADPEAAKLKVIKETVTGKK